MILGAGTLSDGLNADSEKLGFPTTLSVPVGGMAYTGMPLARNLSVIQSNWLTNLAAVVPNAVGGDTGVPPTFSSSGYPLGVFYGGPQINAWNLPTGVANTAALAARGLTARGGLTPVLCGAQQGGTAITVGAVVGKSAATAASSFPYLSVVASTNGLVYGTVCASPITTYLATAVTTAGASQAVNVYDATGFTTTQAVTINPGASNAETVIPTAVTLGQSATNTITIANNAAAASTISTTLTLTGYAGSGVTITTAITSGTTPTNAALAVLQSLWNSGFSYGPPPNVFGTPGTVNAAGSALTGALVYATSAAGVITLSATYPGTWGNSIGLTVSTTDGTQTVTRGAATFANGTNNSVTAVFQNTHVIGEPVVGLVTTVGATLAAVPTVTLAQVARICLVDITEIG